MLEPVIFANRRVLSGMRPTGHLHLGHYHGVLKKWIEIQHEYECFFFVADWHALTTHYEDTQPIEQHVWDLVSDWLAAGINPSLSTLFIQSRIPEHAQLHLLLSMITPLGWLERVPSFKDQQAAIKDKDLSTYGFLGYPLLQSADILAYRAGWVPVGEDQLAHVELTREIARRFNYLYGREPGFVEKAKAAMQKTGKKNASLLRDLQKQYQQQGNKEALVVAKELIINQGNLTIADQERLLGYMEGLGKVILPEPQPLLTPYPKLPGLDGQKMSKSYNNTITLRDKADDIDQKIRTMPTDPARVRRTDPGDPRQCPVWQLHQVYSDQQLQANIMDGCRSAGIGCVDCKGYIIDAIQAELAPMQERIQMYLEDPQMVRNMINEGCEKARDEAAKTLHEVIDAMGLDY